jgi:hypothetical protein
VARVRSAHSSKISTASTSARSQVPASSNRPACSMALSGGRPADQDAYGPTTPNSIATSASTAGAV